MIMPKPINYVKYKKLALISVSITSVPLYLAGRIAGVFEEIHPYDEFAIVGLLFLLITVILGLLYEEFKQYLEKDIEQESDVRVNSLKAGYLAHIKEIEEVYGLLTEDVEATIKEEMNLLQSLANKTTFDLIVMQHLYKFMEENRKKIILEIDSIIEKNNIPFAVLDLFKKDIYTCVAWLMGTFESCTPRRLSKSNYDNMTKALKQTNDLRISDYKRVLREFKKHSLLAKETCENFSWIEKTKNVIGSISLLQL